MKYSNVFHLVSEVFNKTGASCVLIGGFAVNYYKVTRQTADVDFLIIQDDFKKILNLLEEEGYKVDYAQEVFARLKSNKFYLMDLLKLHSLKYNPKLRENKDLPDIIDLIRIHKLEVKGKEFRDLCLKFGTEELYNKVLERV